MAKKKHSGKHPERDFETSEVALKLQELKEAMFTVINSREVLPQPLFWSLFHHQVEDLKEKKRLDKIKRWLQY